MLLWLDEMEREEVIQQWIKIIHEDQGGRVGQDKGFLYVIWDGLLVAGPLQDEICKGLHKRWNSGHDIESRSTILQRLAKSSVLDTHAAIFADMIADGLDDYTTNARGDVGSLVRIEAVGAAGRIWRNGLPKAEETGGVVIFQSLFGKVLRLAAEKLDKIRAEAQQVVLLVMSQSHLASTFRKYTISSYEYFRALLDMGINKDALASGSYEVAWRKDLLEGYVSSADTGSEDLVRASRAAFADFCEAGNTNMICTALFEVAKRNSTNDRVLVPTLEVMSFLFDVRIIQKSSLNWRSLYLLVQKAHYKTGNIRKLEASIKMYGGLIEVYPEALQKLSSMLLHPFPKIRNQVADTLFVVRGVGEGVNWVKAGKGDLQKLKGDIEIAEKERQPPWMFDNQSAIVI